MGDNLQKNIGFFRRTVKNNGIVVVCDLFDVCDKKLLLESLKHPIVLRFLPGNMSEDEKIWQKTLQTVQKRNLFLIFVFINAGKE